MTMPKSVSAPQNIAAVGVGSPHAAVRTRALRSGPLARTALLGLSIGTVMLVPLDWLHALEVVAFPFHFYVRALLLAVFTLYIIHTGVSFAAYRFRFGHVLLYYLAVNLTYTALSEDIGGNLFYVSKISFWILGTIVAYRLALSGALSEKILHRTITATVAIGAMFAIYFMTLPETAPGQNAGAYLLVWCLPLLLIGQKSRTGNIVLLVAAVAVLLTVKRGAMIALGLSSIAYGLSYLRLRRNSRASARVTTVLVLLAVISTVVVSRKWDAVQTRFADTTGSGRDKMYGMLVQHWGNGELPNVVLGFGIRSVQEYTGMMLGREDGRGPYAHSDWLQMMHDFGLLGIGFMVWIHAAFLSLIHTSRRIRHPLTPSLVMGYVVLFLVNIYSGHLMAPGAIYFGFLIAWGAAAIHGKQRGTYSVQRGFV